VTTRAACWARLCTIALVVVSQWSVLLTAVNDGLDHWPWLFARGIWCMTIIVAVVVSSSMSQILYFVVKVVTGMDEELKARNQTKTMPYRVRDQTVGTAR
jgi:hypothetical protein